MIMDEFNRSDVIHIKPEPLPNDDQMESEERISKDVSQGIAQTLNYVRCRNE